MPPATPNQAAVASSPLPPDRAKFRAATCPPALGAALQGCQHQPSRRSPFPAKRALRQPGSPPVSSAARGGVQSLRGDYTQQQPSLFALPSPGSQTLALSDRPAAAAAAAASPPSRAATRAASKTSSAKTGTSPSPSRPAPPAPFTPPALSGRRPFPSGRGVSPARSEGSPAAGSSAAATTHPATIALLPCFPAPSDRAVALLPCFPAPSDRAVALPAATPARVAVGAPTAQRQRPRANPASSPPHGTLPPQPGSASVGSSPPPCLVLKATPPATRPARSPRSPSPASPASPRDRQTDNRKERDTSAEPVSPASPASPTSAEPEPWDTSFVHAAMRYETTGDRTKREATEQAVYELAERRRRRRRRGRQRVYNVITN